MQTTNSLVETFHLILTADDQMRKGAERLLAEFRRKQPLEYIWILLSIVRGGSQLDKYKFDTSEQVFLVKQQSMVDKIRLLAIMQLQISLSVMSSQRDANILSSLSQQVLENVKTILFEILYHQEDGSLSMKLSNTIGHIAASVLKQNALAWPDFKQLVWNLFEQQSNQTRILSGFSILNIFLSKKHEEFIDAEEHLNNLFLFGLAHPTGEVKRCAMECIKSYLHRLDHQQFDKFRNIAPNICLAAVYLFQSESDERGIILISEMTEDIPLFFKNQSIFQYLVTTLQKLYSLPHADDGIRKMVIEIYITLTQNLTKMVQTLHTVIKPLLEMIFTQMVDISDTIRNDWCLPEEGFNQSDTPQDDLITIKNGLESIDNLFENVGAHIVYPYFREVISTLFQKMDWRFYYAVIMAVSQIGQYFTSNIQQIDDIIKIAISFLKNQNPMLRYAACHAIGQMSDDLDEDFHKYYRTQSFQALFFILKNDSVPRVSAHAACALTNFLQGITYEQFDKEQLHNLIDVLLRLIGESPSIKQQAAMNALSTVIQLASDNYEPFIKCTMDLLFDFFKKDKYANRQYQGLKGQAIDTMTILAGQMGMQFFEPYVDEVIKLLSILLTQQFQFIDRQRFNLMQGWQRICQKFKKIVLPQLPNIIPDLLNLIEKILNQCLDLGESESRANSELTNELDAGFELIHSFSRSLEVKYAPYVERTITLMHLALTNIKNEDILLVVLKCMPKIVSAAQKEDSSENLKIARFFIALLYDMFSEKDGALLKGVFTAIGNIFKVIQQPFMDQNEVNLFEFKMIAFLKKTDLIKEKQRRLLQKGVNEEEIKEQKQYVISSSEKIELAAGELIGTYLKIYSKVAHNLIRELCQKTIAQIFKEDNESINMVKLGLYFIDDLIEHASNSLLQNDWFNFTKILLLHSQSTNCQIRQAACFGLGELVTKIPPELIETEFIIHCLNELMRAMTIEKGDSDRILYECCEDNIIASIGKIIFLHFEKFDYLPYIYYWSMHMPLKQDLHERTVSANLFITTLIEKPHLRLNTDQLTSFQDIFRILAEIIGWKKVNKQLKALILTYVKNIMDEPEKRDMFHLFIQNFSQKQIKTFSKLFD